MENIPSDENVDVTLRYGGCVIANYEFKTLEDANAFLLKLVAADLLNPLNMVKCRVGIESVTEHESGESVNARCALLIANGSKQP